MTDISDWEQEFTSSYNDTLQKAILRIKGANQSDAVAWDSTQEQWIFCEQYLDITASFPGADGLVESLEFKFESMIDRTEVIPNIVQYI